MSSVVRVAASRWSALLVIAALVGCGGDDTPDTPADAGSRDAALPPDAGPDPDAAPPACATPVECAAQAEQRAADRFDAVLGDPLALTVFLAGVPKGADLHNHLSGAVYAETFLDWARADGNCINATTFAAVFAGQCSTTNLPTPVSGAFYDQIVAAWSMEGFVPGAQSGHDHFFATFGKFGAIAGAHRDDELADVATRAASENQLYVETMFNLARNVGTLAAADWAGTVTAADLPTFYATLTADPLFASRVAADVAVVTSATTGYRAALGCDGIDPPSACDVTMRFVAQVSRTGANDQIFGQLVGAFEMARATGQIVGANLSSPEDDSAALTNYELHMAMLDFLYHQYTESGVSPLQVTLHAGELTPAFLPPGSTANTFHIRRAVEVGHATRIGHGLDVLSETDATGLLDLLRDRDVLVEICLSSNDQILEVSGAAHPLAAYLARGVPVALATDDQGVSRSSLAGEYRRAALDQHLTYRQLKAMARASLEHAFAPGPSLWTSITTVAPVAACAATATVAVGGPPAPACQQFLDTSERARLQWELERRFLSFERSQPGA
ncbi:MAG: adenosine deaminase [Myxococcales bacterium]|nr:adenosine deaminase [Myxococcales bacterium]